MLHAVLERRTLIRVTCVPASVASTLAALALFPTLANRATVARGLCSTPTPLPHLSSAPSLSLCVLLKWSAKMQHPNP